MLDHNKAQAGLGYLAAKREANPPAAPNARAAVPLKAAESPIELVSAESIKLAPITWLWEGYLARGKVHILAGAPGTGKTTLALTLAAIVSRGGYWPDGSETTPGNVLIWSGEDGVEDVLMPRLIAAEADVTRVKFVGGCGQGNERGFDPSTDFPALSFAVATFKPSLILIDPIVSAVRGDSHKNTEVRRGLQPIVDFAEHNDCAVLGITHFSKGAQGLSVIDRVTGSLAFAAVPRIVFATGRLSDSRGGGMVLVRVKSNIGLNGGGFGFATSQVEVPKNPGVVAAQIEWTGAVAGTPEEILAPADPRIDREEGGARPFLRKILADGPRLAADIFREGEALGFNRRALQRACKRLGVRSRKQGMTGGFEWSLPEDDSSKAEDAIAENPSPSSSSASSKMTVPLEDDVDDIKSCCEPLSPSGDPETASA